MAAVAMATKVQKVLNGDVQRILLKLDPHIENKI
jgi:hypothetical protein